MFKVNNIDTRTTAGVVDLLIANFLKQYPVKWFLKSIDYRSNRPEVFREKVVLKNFVIFTGKQLCWSLFY